jgi:probable rRNA maturation factor
MNEAADKPAGISVKNEQDAVEIDLESIKSLAGFALAAENASGRGELAITFVSSEEIASLNAQYRHKEGATDVLSFSLTAGDEDGFVTPVPLLGNIVICPEVAAANAAVDGREPKIEIYLLVAHGILHLLDYGHATETAEAGMFKKQSELVDKFLKREAAAG